jgi:lipid-binding SYLF domain-containing protein
MPAFSEVSGPSLDAISPDLEIFSRGNAFCRCTLKQKRKMRVRRHGCGLMRESIMTRRGFIQSTLLMIAVAMPLAVSKPSSAATGKEITEQSEQALTRLYNEVPTAREYGRKAKGILVFPEVTKAGIGIGGSHGEGALFVGGKPVDYYSVGSGSLGLTLGAQSFSQVIMFMTDEGLQKFRSSKGWEAGVDGSVVAIKEGAAGSITTAPDPVVGFIFGQAGLMFDASFSGAKYTKIRR